MTAPTPVTRHLLACLALGHQLQSHPQGWRTVTAAAFERVDKATVNEALAAGWIVAAQGQGPSIVWVLTDEGRAALGGDHGT